MKGKIKKELLERTNGYGVSIVKNPIIPKTCVGIFMASPQIGSHEAREKKNVYVVEITTGATS